MLFGWGSFEHIAAAGEPCVANAVLDMERTKKGRRRQTDKVKGSWVEYFLLICIVLTYSACVDVSRLVSRAAYRLDGTRK
jgi:hypothetical protein